MKIQLLSLLLATTLSGCDTKKTTANESTADTQIDSVDSTVNSTDTVTDQKQCYAYTSEKGDTIQLSLTRQNQNVSGTLLYSLAEKDRNNGTLRGHMRGDTLLADYTFWSEGVESVREVAFLTHGDGFVEGYGSVLEENGKEIFNRDSTLTFDFDWVLKKTACPKEK